MQHTEAIAEGRFDPCFKTSSLYGKRAYRLHIFTNGNTTAAENTFTVIPSDGQGRVVYTAFAFYAGKPYFIHAQFMGNLLQFAVKITGAGKTIHRMIGEKHLHGKFPGLSYLFRIGVHLEAL